MAQSIGERPSARTRVPGPHRWPLWLQVTAAYLGLRLVSGVLLALAAHDQVWFAGVTGPREGDVDLALSWDAQWYERIATGGYPDALPVGTDGRVQQNPWAFYPLYPLTIRVVSEATSLDFATVAPLLALAAGLGAAIVMARLVIETVASASPALAVAVVSVWAALPASPVLQMAYTESFSMLLLVGFLLLLVRGRWVGCGLVALLIGLTRPIALPLSVVVVVAVWLRWRERSLRPISRREGLDAAVAVVATGLSGLMWTALAWVGTGERDAYPSTMTAWRGEDAISPVEPWRRTLETALDLHTRESVVPALAMVTALTLSLLLLVPGFASGIDLRLRVWSAAYAVYLLAVVDGGTSIVRYLMPLFALAIVLIGAHREQLSRWWRWRAGFFVAVGIVGQAGWIWWLVVFTPPSDFPP